MNWFKQLTVGGRLTAGFAVMIAITAVISLQGVLGSRTIHSELEDIFTIRMPGIDFLIEADRDLQQLLVAERSMVFADPSSDAFKSFLADYTENHGQAWQRWSKYAALAVLPEERAILPKFEAAFAEWSKTSQQVVDGCRSGDEQRRQAALELSLGQASREFESMRDYIDQLTEINLKSAEQAHTTAASAYRKGFKFQVAFSLLVLLAGIGLTWTIRRSIAGPLKKVIHDLSSSSDQLTSASEQVANTSTALSDGASQQAAATEETSASLEEMATTTRKNAENARQADDLMQQTNEAVATADKEMQALDTSMQKITAASEETQRIVKTIDEISFQTNLLALNAAVEAARAGEAGKGFAVVAEEVRNLAQRAAEAARNTAGQIEEIVTKIHAGSELVTRTATVFKSVSDNSENAGVLIGQIAAASGEQSQGIDQITRAVSDLDGVIQGTAANAEESASVAEEMTAQSRMLRSYVAELQVLVGGTAAPVAAYRPTGRRAAIKPVAARPAARPMTTKPAAARPAAAKPGAAKPATAKPAAKPKPQLEPNDVIPLDLDDLDDSFAAIGEDVDLL